MNPRRINMSTIRQKISNSIQAKKKKKKKRKEKKKKREEKGGKYTCPTITRTTTTITTNKNNNSILSLTSLNINGLNSQIKRQRLTEWMLKQDISF
jgi:transcription elongation factor Elf1